MEVVDLECCGVVRRLLVIYLYLWIIFIYIFILSQYTFFFFFFQADDGIRDRTVTGVQTCALPIASTCCRTPATSTITRPRCTCGGARCCTSPSACTPTACRTGPARVPIPRTPCGLLSTCTPPALAFTRGPSPETSLIRRKSRRRYGNASRWCTKTSRATSTKELDRERDRFAWPGSRAAGGGPGGRGGKGIARAPPGRLGGRGPGGGAGGRGGVGVAGRGVFAGRLIRGRAAGGAAAGDGGGGPAGYRGDDAGERNAGVRGILDGAGAGRRDADPAAEGRAGDRPGAGAVPGGQRVAGGAAVRQRAGVAGAGRGRDGGGRVPAEP